MYKRHCLLNSALQIMTSLDLFGSQNLVAVCTPLNVFSVSVLAPFSRTSDYIFITCAVWMCTEVDAVYLC